MLASDFKNPMGLGIIDILLKKHCKYVQYGITFSKVLQLPVKAFKLLYFSNTFLIYSTQYRKLQYLIIIKQCVI